MSEHIAHKIGPSQIDITYRVYGDQGDPAILLIMGLAAQLVHWPRGFVDALVQRGFRVIAFDNRDAGRSTHMSDAPVPDIPAALSGNLGSVSYTLSEMAADAVSLLDWIGIDSAHTVGASMGGAIAQTMAIEHPARVRSLTSMMFTTGAPAVGHMHPEAAQVMFAGGRPASRDEAIARALRMAPLVRSPRFPTPPEAVAEVTGLAWDRDHDEVAPARQGLGVIASGDRTERLRDLDLPALVIHGSADRVCDPSGGMATAEAIPNARCVIFDGMGHDLPVELHPTIADEIAAVAALADAGRVSGALPGR